MMGDRELAGYGEWCSPSMEGLWRTRRAEDYAMGRDTVTNNCNIFSSGAASNPAAPNHRTPYGTANNIPCINYVIRRPRLLHTAASLSSPDGPVYFVPQHQREETSSSPGPPWLFR